MKIGHALTGLTALLSFACSEAQDSDLSTAADAQITVVPHAGYEELSITGISGPAIKAVVHRSELIAEGVLTVFQLHGDTDRSSQIPTAVNLIRNTAKAHPEITFHRPHSADKFLRRTDTEARRARAAMFAVKRHYGITKYAGVAYSGGFNSMSEAFSRDPDMVCLVSVAGTLYVDMIVRSQGDLDGIDPEEFDPINRVERLPTDRPIVHLHSRDDPVAPFAIVSAYQRAIGDRPVDFRFIDTTGAFGNPHRPITEVPKAIYENCPGARTSG